MWYTRTRLTLMPLDVTSLWSPTAPAWRSALLCCRLGHRRPPMTRWPIHHKFETAGDAALKASGPVPPAKSKHGYNMKIPYTVLGSSETSLYHRPRMYGCAAGPDTPAAAHELTFRSCALLP